MKALIYVNSTFNNTIINLTDLKGNTIHCTSAGKNKFSGAKKSTPYAAQITTNNISKIIKKNNILSVDVIIKGPGVGRDSVLRTLNSNKINITSISDVTPVPHNGCRPPKKRRI
ncbi:30S ribosomal protein S11 [Candidatus Vidania fulgoroideorum]